MQCRDCKFWSKERLNTQAGLFAECELPASERWWSTPACPSSGLKTRLDFGCVQFVYDGATHTTFGLMESPERCRPGKRWHEMGPAPSLNQAIPQEVNQAAA
ncbi:MAG TPA: hypothetical protein VII23_00615 [Terriglobales bacterium]